jgi:hypothetical protein
MASVVGSESGSCRSRGHGYSIHLTGRGIDQRIGRLHILVNQPSSVQAAEGGCEADGTAQELRCVHRSRKRFLERVAARIFERQHRLSPLLGEGERMKPDFRAGIYQTKVSMTHAVPSACAVAPTPAWPDGTENETVAPGPSFGSAQRRP